MLYFNFVCLGKSDIWALDGELWITKFLEGN